MAVVWIPSLMRDLTAGQDRVHVSGATISEVIDALEKAHPGVKGRLLAGDQLAPGVMVAVDGRRALRGLKEQVGAESNVRFLPITTGG